MAVFSVFFIFSILSGFFFSYDRYHENSYPNGWKCANYSKELALYLNSHMRPSERLMLTQFSYWGPPLCSVCPVFLYYLDGKPVYVKDGRDSVEEVIKAIVNNRISWFAINDSADERLNFHPLVNSAANSVLGKPVLIGSSYVWKTDNLRRGDNK